MGRDLLLALLSLGLPLTLLSWLVFSWLYEGGALDRAQGRDKMGAQLKRAHKELAGQKRSRVHYVYDKWHWFGSGFYGLAALWTFAVMEISQLLDFLFDLPGWQELTRGGLVGLLIDLTINQLVNVLEALLWFAWWPSENLLLWIFIAYLGYWLGVELARRNAHLTMLAGWNRLRSRLQRTESS